MKKLFAGILALILTLSFAACGGDGGESSPTPAEETAPAKEIAPAEENTSVVTEIAPTTESSEADAVQVTVALPEGWARVEGSVLEHQYMKSTASFMLKPENYTGETLDDVVTEALDILGGAFDQLETRGDPESITVDGRDAKKVTFTCVVSDIEMKYTYVFVFVGDETYVLTFGDFAGTFDSLSADYDQIISGVKFE